MKRTNTRLFKLLLTLSTVFCLSIITGCPEKDTGDGTTTTEPDGECRKNIDCGAGSVCQKKTTRMNGEHA